MEKEKKGLFGRLMEFWREKTALEKADGIGFWNDADHAEKYFAEKGAVSSVMQEEIKKVFWKNDPKNAEETKFGTREETAEEQSIFFIPEKEIRPEVFRKDETETDRSERNKWHSEIFRAEIFRDRETQEDEKPEKKEKTFLWGKPEETEQMARRIIPVEEAVTEKKKFEEKDEQETARTTELPERKEKQTETNIDIEKLMCQITKKLWEEREGCGRRLR